VILALLAGKLAHPDAVSMMSYPLLIIPVFTKTLIFLPN